MAATSQARSPDSSRSGRIAIHGDGLAACILAASLARGTGREVTIIGPETVGADYQILLERSDLLIVARRLGVPAEPLLRLCVPVAFTYASWRGADYLVTDHLVSPDRHRLVVAKCALEAAAREAVRELGVAFAARSDERGRGLKGPRLVVNASGRGGFHRFDRPPAPHRFSVNPYVRFVGTTAFYERDGFCNAHVIEALREGWLSMLPIERRAFEIIFYTDRRAGIPDVRASQDALARLCGSSPIVERLAASGDFRLLACERGFTVTSDRAAVVAPGRLAVGDALFPVDPLAGQGVKFVLWSTDLAFRSIDGENQTTRDYSLRAAAVARDHHLRRAEVYRASRWHSGNSSYWDCQAGFSERAALQRGADGHR